MHAKWDYCSHFGFAPLTHPNQNRSRLHLSNTALKLVSKRIQIAPNRTSKVVALTPQTESQLVKSNENNPTVAKSSQIEIQIAPNQMKEANPLKRNRTAAKSLQSNEEQIHRNEIVPNWIRCSQIAPNRMKASPLQRNITFKIASHSRRHLSNPLASKNVFEAFGFWTPDRPQGSVLDAIHEPRGPAPELTPAEG